MLRSFANYKLDTDYELTATELNAAGKENVLTKTAFHEVFHWLGFQGETGKTEQKKLIDSVLKALERSGKNVQAMRDEYEEGGYSADVIDEEIAADYFAVILADKYLQKEAAKGNEGLFRKVLDHVKAVLEGLRKKIKETFSYEPATMAALEMDVDTVTRQVEEFETALKKVQEERAENNNSEFGNRNSELTEIKHSYAGVGSATADKTLLERAEEMEKRGQTSEEIRQRTGWFRGYDGKWRYEVDDSTAKLKEDPNFEIYETDDGEIFRTAPLKDLLENAKVLSSYPELGDYTVIIQDTMPGVEGETFPKWRHIVLNQELFKRYTKEYDDYLNGGRKQKIAEIEITPEYRAYAKYFDDEYTEKLDPETWLREEKAAQDKFFSSELGKRYYQLQWGKVDIQKYEPGWSKEAKTVLFHEIQHAVQNIEGFAKGANPEYWKRKGSETPGTDYENTAGEIEARDVSSRIKMTAEERKEKRPDIDRTDVVFADGISATLSIEHNIDFANVTPATENEAKDMNMDDIRNVARFAGEVDKVLAKSKKSTDLILVGKPSEILDKYLKSTNTIYMPQSAIRKAVLTKDEGGKHGLGVELLYDLPYQLADPIVITGNTTKHAE